MCARAVLQYMPCDGLFFIVIWWISRCRGRKASQNLGSCPAGQVWINSSLCEEWTLWHKPDHSDLSNYHKEVMIESFGRVSSNTRDGLVVNCGDFDVFYLKDLQLLWRIRFYRMSFWLIGQKQLFPGTVASCQLSTSTFHNFLDISYS